MKPKKLNKKLALNKKTVANLDDKEMTVIQGGGFTDDTCGSCYEHTFCWGCPTLICPDYPPTTAPPNTEYYSCVDETCVCSEHNYSCTLGPCG
jgi:natural product precursor